VGGVASPGLDFAALDAIASSLGSTRADIEGHQHVIEPRTPRSRCASPQLMTWPLFSRNLAAILSIPISTRNPGYKKFEHGIRGDFARGDCDPDIRNFDPDFRSDG